MPHINKQRGREICAICSLIRYNGIAIFAREKSSKCEQAKEYATRMFSHSYFGVSLSDPQIATSLQYTINVISFRKMSQIAW